MSYQQEFPFLHTSDEVVMSLRSEKGRYKLDFGLMGIVVTVVLLITACQMPTLAVDESRLKRARVMPNDVAMNIIAKYEDREWVDNPYFLTQVNHLRRSDLRTDRIEYNVKKYVGYRKMTLSATFQKNCVNLFPYPLERYDPNRLTTTYYRGKTICTGFIKERDELVDAFLALGARIKR